jgi:prepilin-type N-terminal cleavage/methylation domain-containing protein
MMKTSNKGGFSLIELLVALSILAVVAAIIVPRFINVRSQAAAATAQGQQQILQTAIQQWLALGGSPGTEVTSSTLASTVYAGRIISFLTSASGRTTTAANGACSDSSGTMSSATISLGTLTASTGPTTQGFQVTTSAATYYDGAGNTWAIYVNPADGNTALYCTAGASNLIGSYIGGTN